MDDRDPDLFRALYREHYAAVHRFLARRSSRDRADDLAAETFLVAWRRADRIPERPFPWLLNVATKVLANERRAGDRVDALADLMAHQPASASAAPSAAEAAEQRRERAALLAALATLSPDDRELMLLHVWEDLRPREIAVVLDVSAVNARARLSRARRRLQRSLTAALAEGDPEPLARPPAPSPAPAAPPCPSPATSVAGHRPNRSHS